MKLTRFLFVALFFTISASAIEDPMGGGSLAPPPAVFSHNETSSFLPKVNVITGEYHEEEIDLVVAGCEPISIRRFYNHLGHKNQAYGHWNINPETLMLFNFWKGLVKSEPFMGVGDEGGNFILCEKKRGDRFTFDSAKHTNFTNLGNTHPLNVHFSSEKVKPKNHEYYWEGEIEDGSGRKRFYRTEIGLWNQSSDSLFQACIHEEKRPNGNIIYYTYEDYNRKIKRESHYKNLSTYYILRSISAYSNKGEFLGSVKLEYPDKLDGKSDVRKRYIHRLEISGSDQRKATLFNHIREVEPERKFGEWPYTEKVPAVRDVVLDYVQTPSKPTQSYNYRWERSREYYENNYMYASALPEGRIFKTHYDLDSNKVVEQTAPVGPNHELQTVARYVYEADHTVVFDGENNTTLYRFNNDKRITAIEKYDGSQLISVECNEWNSLNGNLIKKQIEDGPGNILRTCAYKYDNNHNIIEEKIGDGHQHDTIYRTFSENGFNLKEEEWDNTGKSVRINYIPNTNLVSAELTLINDQIVKRTFHFYDEKISSVRIKTISDDGRSEAPFDLAGITYRKILEFEPKREVPCVGLPIEIREKTLDTNGDEILLKKVCYTYHPSGKVEREDHYDANNAYRYSISNEYDENERLIATTDALGNRSSFIYDANFNLISQDGPRPDMHKEWSYDLVNRPIQESELQTDGTTLVAQKKYDKCSRLISQTDSCGFETCYEYDGLGHVITVIHPDGAIERKEYDALGNITRTTDANGYITRKEYNFRNQPTAIYHADGREEHFTYNIDRGTLASHIAPSGTKTVYAYDRLDNLIKTEIFSPKGELLVTTSATYSPFYKLSETDGEGITTNYAYDFAGRLIAKQIGEQVVSYEYNELGHRTLTHEGEVITSNIFDLKGQLLEKKIIDSNNIEYFKETYTYDEAGNQISIATCEGNTTTAYNSQGQPIQTTDPLGNTLITSYLYGDSFIKTTITPTGVQTLEIHDSRGRLTDLQVKNASDELIQRRENKYDSVGNQTQSIEHIYQGPVLQKTITNEWVYGPGGRIEKVIEAGVKVTQYAYDESARLKTVTKPDGYTLHHEYDPLGRLSRYHGTGIDYRYTYDRKGRVLSVYDHVHNNTTLRVYDIYDNLIEEKLATGQILRSDYDPYGKRTAQYLPDDSVINYTYQGPYLFKVSRNGYIHTYSERNLAGKPTLITPPNNLGALTIEWDPLLRWKQFTSSYYQAHCSYDSEGNLTEYAYTDPIGSDKNTYSYDELNQLLSENEHQYQYDSLFNRITKDEATYSLNPLSQITHDGQKEYTYDPNGNLISDGDSTFEYDLLDRLISVTKGSTRTTYTYDPFNRRIAKNNDQYIWDQQNEIGMSRSGYLYELRILGEGLGAEIGSAIILELGGYTYFPIHDIQGSLATMIYTNGRPYATSRYTAFGEKLAGDQMSPWQFASKRYDPETDLTYFGRRYYSPNLGRWITADPQGFNDGPNLYAYVRNSPLLTIDLYGLEGRNGAWASCQGSTRATWDYFYDGFCNLGPWAGSRIKSGYEMQWSLLSDPIGHGKRLWGNVRDFAMQAPQETSWAGIKQGIVGAGEAFFPKNAQALRSISDPTLDDYTRSYRNQQASLELLQHGAMFVAGAAPAFGKAGGVAEGLVDARRLSTPTGSALTRTSIKHYLHNANNLTKDIITRDLKHIGLNLRGKSPDGRYLEFTDRFGNLRAKIHPSDRVTQYPHLHVYDSKGHPLNKQLQVVNKRSPDSHIHILE